MEVEVPVNYLAVLVSALVAMGIGMAWYGPLFGKQWMAMTGISKEGMKSMALSPVVAMVGGLITTLLLMYVFAHTTAFAFAFLGTSGVMGGLSGGFWTWLGFAVPLTAGSFLWEGKSWKLWFLNACYYLVVLLAAGAIIGGWGT
ncbi:MAG: DUF1761 domain-containing protein [Minisyncoccia bacterium]